MANRQSLDLLSHATEVAYRLEHGGVLCTVVDESGEQNLLTLSWGLLGRFYHGRPMFVIAVTPLSYSWHFLEEVPEFVIAVPDDALSDAAAFCGSHSGRDMDKFAAASLTPVQSAHVRAPSILECPLNIECRVYTSVAPPHMLLTPEHREKPISEQHTIYFAEVLGTYSYRG